MLLLFSAELPLYYLTTRGSCILGFNHSGEMSRILWNNYESHGPPFQKVWFYTSMGASWACPSFASKGGLHWLIRTGKRPAGVARGLGREIRRWAGVGQGPGAQRWGERCRGRDGEGERACEEDVLLPDSAPLSPCLHPCPRFQNPRRKKWVVLAWVRWVSRAGRAGGRLRSNSTVS